MNTINILPLRAEQIEAVANLHAAELRYSFNSRLGPAHLARIYRAMISQSDCFVGVALDGDKPVGVVSVTLDVRKLKPAILESLGLSGKIKMLCGLVLHPSAICSLLEEMKSRPQVEVEGQPVNACLTAIAVASTHRRMGLAAKLVSALEEFFRARGAKNYWLDTNVENKGARDFYCKQGFVEHGIHGKTVVLLKEIR